MIDFPSFTNAFKGDIVEPGSHAYPAALSRWAVNAQCNARYVAFPKDETDISLALKFATSNTIPLAIKGGGHNASGASSIEDGLVIDLSRYFNVARVDVEKKVVHVGGGAVWETVDRATIAHGLGTPGGTVNHTGVGGLILGGGYGWLSGEHGLVIDNLVQATVATADGSILTASATSHPDLFWAIRGGGSNFGIVTSFVLKLHPQRKTVFAGPIVFPPPLLAKVAEAVDKWWAAGAGEKEAAMMTLTRGPDRHPVVILMLFFNGSENEGRANFKHFYDIGPVADFAREIPYEQLNSLLNASAAPGRNYYMGGTSLRSPSSPHVQEIFERMISLAAAHPNPESTFSPFDAMIGYEFISLKKIISVPSDATAFRSRGPQPNVVVVISWGKEDTTSGGLQYARTCSKELTDIIESTEEKRPKEDENEGYSNYVSNTSQMGDRVWRLWGDNYPKLQKIKQQYDPTLIFDRWFPIQPAA